MKSANLITTCEGYEALSALGRTPEGPLKAHEIKTLLSLCHRMIQQNCTLEDFNGFYIGYSIQQIGKEFDLLKFTKDKILNIELKTDLFVEDKEEKILRQMRTNHYYLNALASDITILTYVENDSFYLYLADKDTFEKVSDVYAAQQMKQAIEDTAFLPDQHFLPSTYFISPYGNTDKFIHSQYFLTTAQNAIKKEIMDGYENKEYTIYTLQASTGTGKTLLLYNLAKELISLDQHIRILHTQSLNQGQQILIQQYHWDIWSIYTCSLSSVFDHTQFLLIDEAQLLTKSQINLILSLSFEKQIPIFFSYDPIQEQYRSHTFDLAAYIQQKEPMIKVYQSKLTNKIRINKEMADFIDNFMKIHSHPDTRPYQNITIEYLTDTGTLQNYTHMLEEEGFIVIPMHSLSLKSLTGEEYKKAALILDQDYYYEQDVLHSKSHHEEVLYEVITRVMNELKLIVVANADLYEKLLQIVQSPTSSC